MELTPVDEDCNPDDVELDEDVLELEVEVVAVCGLEAVPEIVLALTVLSTPTPAMAANATPVVTRLSRRMAASRAAILV